MYIDYTSVKKKRLYVLIYHILLAIKLIIFLFKVFEKL